MLTDEDNVKDKHNMLRVIKNEDTKQTVVYVRMSKSVVTLESTVCLLALSIQNADAGFVATNFLFYLYQ